MSGPAEGKTGERFKGTNTHMPKVMAVTSLQCPRRREGQTHLLTNVERGENVITQCRYCHAHWSRLDAEARP